VHGYMVIRAGFESPPANVMSNDERNTMKRIGYGKIGRVTEISESNWGQNGGDNEPATLLLTLAKRHPEVTWVCVGRNSGWKPPLPNIENPWIRWGPLLQGIAKYSVFEQLRQFDAITGPTFDGLDGIVMWLGQHGTSNTPVPKIANRMELTSPQISFMAYCAFIIRGINRWREVDPISREEVWVIADARNLLKAHDLKWPRRHPLLGQFDLARNEWEERYGDSRTPEECGFFNTDVIDGKWRATDHYEASGLELVGIRERLVDAPQWGDRRHFGVIINEARNYGMTKALTRLHAMQNYIVPLRPAFIHGNWSAASLAELGFDITPWKYGDLYEKVATVKSTFTTPSSGSGWITAKPWESFASGTICFFHPAYDTQEHIFGDYPGFQQLRSWLRVDSPGDLKIRVETVNEDEKVYNWLRDEQYRLLETALQQQRAVCTIEQRLAL
jgi:hypothetical protein